MPIDWTVFIKIKQLIYTVTRFYFLCMAKLYDNLVEQNQDFVLQNVIKLDHKRNYENT